MISMILAAALQVSSPDIQGPVTLTEIDCEIMGAGQSSDEVSHRESSESSFACQMAYFAGQEMIELSCGLASFTLFRDAQSGVFHGSSPSKNRRMAYFPMTGGYATSSVDFYNGVLISKLCTGRVGR